VSRGRRIALLTAVLAQLAVPLGLAGLAAADLAFGRELRLVAQPVDPVDIFRGNYVVLRYEISTVTAGFTVRRGERVCVRLHERDGAWTGDFGIPDTGDGDTVVCGRARSDAEAGSPVGVEYGIETYYASAERAQELERLISRGELVAVIDLDEDGSARIERLEVDEEEG
jgi:uncharacterized membrane-anchored protein